MSDFALSPRSGLEHLLLPGTRGALTDAPGVVVALRPDLALAFVMARKGKAADLRQRVQDRFGLTLPTTAQRVEKSGGLGLDSLSFIWAGPGRWLDQDANTNGHLARGDAAPRVIRPGLGGEPDGWALRLPC